MALIAWVLGVLSISCTALGVVTAAEVLAPFYDALTPQFWLMLAIVLMLAAIAATLGRGRQGWEE